MFYAVTRNVCLFSRPLFPACFKRRSLRYSCSVLPLQALCKYSCPPQPAGCWSILKAYICISLSVSCVIKLNDMMYTITVSALLKRKVSHMHMLLYGVVRLLLGRLQARIENDQTNELMALQSTEGFSAQLVLLQFSRITMTTPSCFCSTCCYPLHC